MRIRLDIAYDGTFFRGWARQPGLRTVQETIEQAIARIVGGDPRLVVAGRTDAGVHATGQVAHVDLDEAQQRRLLRQRERGALTPPVDSPPVDTPPGDAPTDGAPAAPDPVRAAGLLAARIGGVLGSYSDVTVTRSALAPEGFDARFSPVWRRYSYRVADRSVDYDPMARHRTTNVRGVLDVEAMDAAARSLIGLHDFAAYCKPREGATTIRTLLEFDWHRDEFGVLVANVKADAFCHSMVRALVGACVAVGDGRLEVPDAAQLRDAGVRTSRFPVLVARGLTLVEVGYPADDLLGVRAEQTRARRDAS